MPRIGGPTSPTICLSLVGGIGLSNLRRGVPETASLGHWVGEPFARQGYMTAALPLVLDLSFHRLRLHRVEAACLPSNIPSRALLKRASFRQERLRPAISLHRRRMAGSSSVWDPARGLDQVSPSRRGGSQTRFTMLPASASATCQSCSISYFDNREREQLRSLRELFGSDGHGRLTLGEEGGSHGHGHRRKMDRR
jgi:hypothetical protein